MNQALENLLAKGAQYYTPAQTVELAAEASDTIIFTGYSSRRYGLNRFVIGGTGLTQVTATAKLVKGKKETIFEDIQLATLRNLFLNRSLRGAFVIEESTELHVTLTNTDDGNAHTVNVGIIGYDDKHLAKKEEDYTSRGLSLPVPEFVFVSDDVAAGATSKRISIPLPAYPLRLYRLAISSDEQDSLLISLRQDQVRIKPEVFVSQVNDEFANMDIILPQNLKASIPFDLYVTNTDAANAHTISFLAETYKL